MSRTQTLYVWNWTTSAWVQIDQATVSTSDVTRSWSTGSPAAYISPTLEVRLRVATNSRTKSFTCRGDHMAFNYDYTAGTVRVPAPTLYAAQAIPIEGDKPVAAIRDAHLAEGAEEQPLRVLRSIEAVPTTAGADLRWTISTADHADGFNVYRVDAQGELEFAGNEMTLSIAGEEATFRFFDRDHGQGTTYWLGVRGCSGPESRIGPLVVAGGPLAEGIDAAPSLALRSTPNPAISFAGLSFSLPAAGRARIDIFDAAGRRIASPLDGELEAGAHEIRWDLGGSRGRVSAGIYFARLEAVGRTLVNRLTVLGN